MVDMLIRLDQQSTRLIQGWPSQAKPVMRFCTIIGAPPVLALSGVVGCTLANSSADRPFSSFFIAGMVLIVLEAVLKHLLVGRPRPDTEYARNMWPKTSSFPSGHAFAATLVFGLWACLIAGRLGETTVWFATSSAIFLIVLVGYSRVYMGAHYLSDVLAGWILGSFCLFAIVHLGA